LTVSDNGSGDQDYIAGDGSSDGDGDGDVDGDSDHNLCELALCHIAVFSTTTLALTHSC
jgi:hypothetical protein